MLDRLGAVARDPRRPQMGAQRRHRRDRPRDAGGDEPAISQARLGSQEFCYQVKRQKSVAVHDRMQKRYRYTLVAAGGRSFDPEFTPDLTPAEMLRLGVFCGKYIT